MMTTNNVRPGHYYYLLNENNQWENHVNTKGIITNRTNNGQYNIIEKNFGDHKQFYFIPSSYDSDYDISQLDETSSPEEDEAEEEEEQQYSPRTIIRRRYYRDYDDDILPMISPRRYVNDTPRRIKVIRRIYYDPPLRDSIPRQRYMEDFQPIHPSLPPLYRSPRLSPIKPHYINELSSPRRSKLKQQTPRIDSPNRKIIRNVIPRNYMSLKDVLAENRARRGSRIPKPRREVDEDEIYDPPTYQRNFIKNGFIVHK